MDDVLVKDILLKAAEDVQSGMWCRGSWFAQGTRDAFVRSGGEHHTDSELLDGSLSVEDAAKSYRCAEGSIVFATKLLGGNLRDYAKAVDGVTTTLELGPPTPCFSPFDTDEHRMSLGHFNDWHLVNDPFEAGQILAELFRSTAEAL